MRIIAGIMTLVLAGCTGAAPISGGNAAPVTAFFPDFPTALFNAVEVVCSKPTQTLRRPDRNTMLCEEVLAPEPTAAAILRYDGTVNDLPLVVVSLKADAVEGGYIVTSRNFLRVPQRDGPAREVVFPNARTDRRMREVFTISGGTPVDTMR